MPLEKNLDPICSPHGNAGTEEIFILSPNWTRQRECGGYYRPVIFISATQSLPGVTFKDGIEFESDRFDQDSQILERFRKVGIGITPFLQKERQIRFGIVKSNVRCEEADTLARIYVDQLPNAASEYGANNYVRVENDHVSGTNACCDAAV